MFGSLNAGMISTINRYIKTLAALIVSCFFVYACENNYTEVQNLGKKKINVEEGRNIESFLSQAGKVKARLTAPLMLRYQLDTPKTEFPNSLKVDFYNDSTKIESRLSAKYGRYLENENKVFLRDSVVVYNVTGDTLNCLELYWDQRQQIFYTDKNVIVTKPDQKIYGKGLTADQNFKWFTIKNMYGYIDIADSSFLAQ